MCTDKVLVRDYVAEKIGSEYLKPVLQVITKEGVYINPVMLNLFQHLSNDELIKKLLDNARLDCHADTKMSSSARNDSGLNTLVPDVEKNVSTYFDKIQFDKLPNAFVMKCSHGCKWQYIIKDKEDFLNNKQLYEEARKNMTCWLEKEFFRGK